MPRQSKPQKATVERVMHEYKHGELKSGSGRKVKSRKQAVAVALSEAGASKNQSPKKNRRNLRRTKRRERQGATGQARAERGRARSRRSGGASRSELYGEAKRRGIAGRSKMNKAELRQALGK
jgi:hypothetical protein